MARVLQRQELRLSGAARVRRRGLARAGAGVHGRRCHTRRCGGGEGDVMYMRARFERVVGSRDSEAFYMMNPDKSSSSSGINGGPELSVI